MGSAKLPFVPRVLDLFCGAGGLSLGFQRAGCEIIGGIDIERWPVETHHKNFPNCRVKLPPTDVSLLDPTELGLPRGFIDILIGGPPCQGFSQVGTAKIRSLGQERKKAKQNRLYRQFIKFLDYFQPKYFVIENVNGMKGVQNINVFNEAIKELSNGLNGQGYRYATGYDVDFKVLCAKDFGVPQRRYRVFIIGRRKDLTDLPVYFPSELGVSPVTLKEAISDLPALVAPILTTKSKKDLGNGGIHQEDKPRRYRSEPLNAYQRLMREEQGPEVMNHLCRGHNEKDLEIFSLLKQGEKYKDLPKSMRRYRDDIFDDKYRRLRYDEVAPTVTAHMQKDTLAFIHPSQTRSISAREAARIQSFPDDFVFVGPLTKVFRQIGNAVPPLLAEQVASVLVHELRSNHAKTSKAKRSRIR